MYIAFVYVLMLLIFSTTPFAIFLSSQDLGHFLSLAVRISIALPLMCLLILVMRQPLQFTPAHWRAYFFASLGLSPNLPLSYWAAQYIPTGLMALIFATAPFFVGVLSHIVLGERLNLRRLVGMAVAFCGLLVIFGDQAGQGSQALMGGAAVLLGTVLYSISAVLVKRVGASSGPLQQAAGSMLFALPSLWLIWFFAGAQPPEALPLSSVSALAYMVVVCSIVGFSAHFYLLARLPANTLALVTMLTPVLAIVIGVLLNDEKLGAEFFTGASLLLLGLANYLGFLNLIYRRMLASLR